MDVSHTIALMNKGDTKNNKNNQPMRGKAKGKAKIPQPRRPRQNRGDMGLHREATVSYTGAITYSSPGALPEGKFSSLIDPTASATFVSEALGHTFFEILDCEVHAVTPKTTTRLGIATWGAGTVLTNNDISLGTARYLTASAGPQPINDGYRRRLPSDFFHRIKGSRFEIAKGMEEKRYWYGVYGKMTDFGAEAPDNTLIAEVTFTFRLRFSTLKPPSAVATSTLTYRTGSVPGPASADRPDILLQNDDRVYRTHIAPGVHLFNATTAQAPWGDPNYFDTKPSNLMVFTHPTSATIDLQIRTARLVPNADALPANAPVPYFATGNMHKGHGDILLQGQPVISQTPGFGPDGLPGATHTLMTVHTHVRGNIRVVDLPDKLSLPDKGQSLLSKASAYLEEHPDVRCLILGLGLTGLTGGLGTAGFLSAETIAAVLATEGVDFASQLVNSIHGSIHTTPLGGNNHTNLGGGNKSGLGAYPGFSVPSPPPGLTLSGKAAYVPKALPDPNTLSLYRNSVDASGNPIPVVPSGGGVTPEAWRHYHLTLVFDGTIPGGNSGVGPMDLLTVNQKFYNGSGGTATMHVPTYHTDTTMIMPAIPGNPFISHASVGGHRAWVAWDSTKLRLVTYNASITPFAGAVTGLPNGSSDWAREVLINPDTGTIAHDAVVNFSSPVGLGGAAFQFITPPTHDLVGLDWRNENVGYTYLLYMPDSSNNSVTKHPGVMYTFDLYFEDITSPSAPSQVPTPQKCHNLPDYTVTSDYCVVTKE